MNFIDKADDSFKRWVMQHPDLEKDVTSIAHQFQLNRKTISGVPLLSELRHRHGDKYAGTNTHAPRITHWFVARHPRYADTVLCR